MLGLLLSIPRDVVRDRITPFIDLGSLVKLDSAAASREQRLNALTHIFSGAVVKEEFVYEKKAIHWLASRNMQLNDIIFPEDANDSDLDEASDVLGKASKIDLSGCYKVSNQGIQNLFSRVEDLDTVFLDNYTKLTDDTVMALADKHRNLTEVCMKSSPHLPDSAIVHLANRCVQLKSLQFQDCTNIGDKAMLALSVHGNLTLISFCGCPLITEEAFLNLISDSKVELHSVIANGNDCITGIVLQGLALKSPGLSELLIKGCTQVTEEGIAAISKACQDLTLLSAGNCNLSTLALDALSANISYELETLSLLGYPNLNDTHVEQITARAGDLECLLLSNAPLLTNQSLKSMGCNLNYLLHLKVSQCPKLTLKGFKILATVCCHLEHLDVSSCANFLDNSLREVVMRCPSLSELVLLDTRVTDKSMQYVADHGRNLTKINIGFTTGINASVELLLFNCDNLKTILCEGAGFIFVTSIV